MCKFNFRYILAILTFGIGVLGVTLWITKTPPSNLPTTEAIVEPVSKYSDNRPQVVISSQPDSPIKITLANNT